MVFGLNKENWDGCYDNMVVQSGGGGADCARDTSNQCLEPARWKHCALNMFCSCLKHASSFGLRELDLHEIRRFAGAKKNRTSAISSCMIDGQIRQPSDIHPQYNWPGFVFLSWNGWKIKIKCKKSNRFFSVTPFGTFSTTMVSRSISFFPFHSDWKWTASYFSQNGNHFR